MSNNFDWFRVIGDYFAGLSNGRLARTVILVTIGFSFFMNSLAWIKIIALAAPILSILSPLIVLVIFAVLDKWITRSKYVGVVAAYTGLCHNTASSKWIRPFIRFRGEPSIH